MHARLSLLVGIGLLPALSAVFTVGPATPTHAGGGLTLWVDADGDCAGNPAETTIQDAVDAATPGSTIFVCPGNYPESVDLGDMNGGGAEGDITLIAVNDAGTPTPGTATVNPAVGVGFSAGPFDGNITLDGFIVLAATNSGIDLTAANDDITLRNITSDGNVGFGVFIGGAASVTIEDSSADNNGANGFDITSSGPVNISDSTANGNDGCGVSISDATDVTITDTEANGNLDGSGFDVTLDGDFSITGGSANGNDANGVAVDMNSVGELTVTGTTAHDTVRFNGFDLDLFQGGVLTITNATANDTLGFQGFDIDLFEAGDVNISGSTANDSDGQGFDIDLFESGDVTISTSVANGAMGTAGFDIDINGGGLTIENSGANLNSADGFDVNTNGGVLTMTFTVAVGNTENGLFVETGEGSSATCNTFDNNSVSGLSLATAVDFDAENNWWGDPSGPTHPENPAGTGDAVIDGANGESGDVDFIPFLTTPPEEAEACPEDEEPPPPGAGEPTPTPTATATATATASPGADDDGEGPSVSTGDGSTSGSGAISPELIAALVAMTVVALGMGIAVMARSK